MSWRLIWKEEIADRLRSAAKMEAPRHPESATAEKPIETPAKVGNHADGHGTFIFARKSAPARALTASGAAIRIPDHL